MKKKAQPPSQMLPGVGLPVLLLTAVRFVGDGVFEKTYFPQLRQFFA
jgi:hypothetical protein